MMIKKVISRLKTVFGSIGLALNEEKTELFVISKKSNFNVWCQSMPILAKT